MGLAIVALAACGGGGGGSDAGPAPASLSFTGTAATGAAMGGAAIAAKCTTGSATGTATANGSYSLAVSGGVLPCLLSATSTDGKTVLHTLAEGSGSSTAAIVANVTPLTELVLARLLANASVADAFAAFSSTTRDKLTVANVAAAVAYVQSALAAIDPAIASIDPLRGRFVAATGSSSGDAVDAVIDKVMAQLAQAAPGAASVAAQIQALAQVVAADTSTNGAAAAGNFLAAPLAGCPSLRNVPYRIVGMHGGFGKTTSLDWAAGKITSAWNDGSSEVGSLSFSSSQACQFTMVAPSSTVDGFAASSGAVVLRDAGSFSGRAGIGLGFPEQKVALAELAGTWNMLEFSTDGVPGGPFTNFQGAITLDATGKFTAEQDCDGTTSSSDACSSTPSDLGLAVHADGGFGIVDKAGNMAVGARVFAFRNAGGTTMLVVSFADGGVMVGARQVEAALPAVGTVTRFWDIQAVQMVGVSGLSTVVDTAEIKVQSVDTTAKTVTRLRTLSNDLEDGRVDVVRYNQPRTGLRFRPAGSYVLSGSTKTFSAALHLPIQGMGLSFATTPGPNGGGSKYLSVSVTQ